MKTIETLKATPMHSADVVPPLTIVFSRNVEEDRSLNDHRRVYAAEAAIIVGAMLQHAPGGLTDAILTELAQRKSSLLRVAHEPIELTLEPAPVASTETHILNLNLLTRVARSPGVQIALINLTAPARSNVPYDFAPIVLEMLAAAGDDFTQNWEQFLNRQAGEIGTQHPLIAKDTVRALISLTPSVREALEAACASGASFDQLVDAVRIVFTVAIVKNHLTPKRRAS